jgi:hypothetical protein
MATVHETQEEKDGFAAASVDYQPRDEGQGFRAEVFAQAR